MTVEFTLLCTSSYILIHQGMLAHTVGVNGYHLDHLSASAERFLLLAEWPSGYYLAIAIFPTTYKNYMDVIRHQLSHVMTTYVESDFRFSSKA